MPVLVISTFDSDSVKIEVAIRRTDHIQVI